MFHSLPSYPDSPLLSTPELCIPTNITHWNVLAWETVLHFTTAKNRFTFDIETLTHLLISFKYPALFAMSYGSYNLLMSAIVNCNVDQISPADVHHSSVLGRSDLRHNISLLSFHSIITYNQTIKFP